MARILIVDDHPHIRRLVERELTADGHEVVTACTGEEALRLVRDDAPALVILDVMLPGIDGVQVLQALKADPANQMMRVVLLTARDAPDAISEGLRLGADWYLTKPFAPGDVASLAGRFLNESAQGRSLREVFLPLEEIDLLTLTAADAFELGNAGQSSDGYRCLTVELERAHAAHGDGHPWAEELAQRYQELLDHYSARFGPADRGFAVAVPGDHAQDDGLMAR